MDYVVFGIGFGATILVLGLLLRDLGPRVRYRRRTNGDGVLPVDVLVAKVAWDRFCNALGAVLAIGGILFLLATVICIFLMLSNDTGRWVMLASLAVFFLMTLYWTWAFFDRFGAYGILPERPVVEEEPEPAPAAPPARQPERAAAASNGGEPAPGYAATVVIGPTLEETGPPEGIERVPDEPEAPAGAEVVGAPPSGDEEGAAPETDGDATAGVEADTGSEAADESPVITPEERLARMEEPIDHGSAAGDLDSEPGTARPTAARGRRAESPRAQAPVEEPGDGEEGDDAAIEGQEPPGEPDAKGGARGGEPDDTESR